MATRGKECPRLSILMLVHNAARPLAASLESVSAIADELLVYDLASTDDSLQQAQQRATCVIAGQWHDSYALARNEALDQATGDWIFWLEPGEELSTDMARSLRQFIDRQARPECAYECLIRAAAQQLEIAGEQVAQVRLHPHRQDLRFSGRVRENLHASLASAQLTRELSPLVIDRHVVNDKSPARRTQLELHITLANRQIEEEGPSASLFNCLGEAWQQMGDHAESAGHYRRALELASRGSDDMLEAWYGLLTSLEGGDASREAQLQLCMTALEIYPLDSQLLCAIGGYLQARGQWDLASRAYCLAAEHGQVNLNIWHLEGLAEIAINCHAQSLQALGRDAEAEQVLTAELARHPHSPRLRRQLLELHVKHGRLPQAEAVVNLLPWHAPEREPLRMAVHGACLAVAGQPRAALAQLEAAYQNGCRDPICLRWLTSLYVAESNFTLADTTLREWLQAEPFSLDARQWRRHLEQSRPAPETPATESGNRRIDLNSPLAKPLLATATQPVR